MLLIYGGLLLVAQDNCIDLSNLYAPFIHCKYGTFYNPDQYDGVVAGRHTVITQQGKDINTCNGLDKIPPGANYSIRLGNDDTGAQAESISVDIIVDTTNFDLLILQYAAVMEDPSHSPVEQPRFTFDILDIHNNPLNEDCLSADFIANPSLGWNYCSGVLWKDWTNVGVDISDFHGQTIRVKLTTYDCSQSGHFGYAYFLLSCGHKHITTEVCGDVSQYTYSAPDGFAYRWYWHDNPSNVLSTQQTVTVPAGGSQTLECAVSFLEKPTCGFNLATTTELRFPISGCSVNGTGYSHGISFHNESFVSNDGVTPDGTGDLCDDVLWIFGDGITSSLSSPTHSYANPGTYLAMMVSGLNGFECADTTFYYINICDTITCDSLRLNDEVYYNSGIYSQHHVSAQGIDSLVYIDLTVNKSPIFDLRGYDQVAISSDLWSGIYNYFIADSANFINCTPTWHCSNQDWLVLPTTSLFQFKIAVNNLGDAILTVTTDCQSGCNSTNSMEIHSFFMNENDYDEDVSLFPNPSSDMVTVNAFFIKRIRIINESGQVVRDIVYDDSDGIVLDISDLRQGIYIIEITTHNDKKYKRLAVIKQ